MDISVSVYGINNTPNTPDTLGGTAKTAEIMQQLLSSILKSQDPLNVFVIAPAYSPLQHIIKFYYQETVRV